MIVLENALDRPFSTQLIHEFRIRRNLHRNGFIRRMMSRFPDFSKPSLPNFFEEEIGTDSLAHFRHRPENPFQYMEIAWG
jgi:hypothetical protein